MFLVGGGEYFIKHDDTGNLVYESPDDRFYEVITKVAEVYSAKDGKVLVNSNDKFTDAGGCCNLFYSGRAGFLTTELKGAKVMRSLETGLRHTSVSEIRLESGELYNLCQREYRAYCTVPVTVSDLWRTRRDP